MITPFRPGDRIAGKYRIVRALGRGGMGVVYQAHHERLDRPVAIKVLHSQLEDQSTAIRRFEREVKAMALVRNPHIAHAFDADLLADGTPYLVMEYLEGHDLCQELELRGAIPFGEAVAYVLQAAEGVAAVHDVGIVHLDLKPHNLFLTELDGARSVKVLDFGIAKFMARPDGGRSEREVAAGTPLYMSPEQLARPELIGPPTDVWALGVVLYELIAGVSPFSADTPGGVVHAVMHEDPAPLCELVPDVPRPLAQVIADALVKSPAARIADARRLAERLAPFAVSAVAVAEPKPAEGGVSVPGARVPPRTRARSSLTPRGVSSSDPRAPTLVGRGLGSGGWVRRAWLGAAGNGAPSARVRAAGGALVLLLAAASLGAAVAWRTHASESSAHAVAPPPTQPLASVPGPASTSPPDAVASAVAAGTVEKAPAEPPFTSSIQPAPAPRPSARSTRPARSRSGSDAAGRSAPRSPVTADRRPLHL